MTIRLTLLAVTQMLADTGCTQDLYQTGRSPQRHSQRSPFPFGPGPQSPADHARALHGISTTQAMCDSCLAAKGYRVE
jgi:hypothetical protein